MNIDFKNELLCLDELTPFKKLFSIGYPDFVNLDLFNDQRFLLIFEVEGHCLALQVISRILKSLDFF